MSLQSYKDDLVSEATSGDVDPGEEAKFRVAIGAVETVERTHDRLAKLSAPTMPTLVEISPSHEDTIDLDDSVDPSAKV